MPVLDKLAVEQGGKMQVLTISQDSQGKEVVSPFFKQRKFAALQPYIDAENQFGFHYASGMLPTTVLYDSDGKEVVRRSEERRVGKECVSQGGSRWSRYH